MGELDHVLAPTTIGAIEVRNRVVMPAHTVLYGEGHHLSDRHIAYYRERALGGTGLIITEGGAVHPSQRGAFHNAFVAYDRDDVPRFARLAETLHELGTKVFMQLFAIGVHARGTHVLDDWTPLWGASPIPSVRDREVPLAMEQEHIDALVEGFAASAANLADAGVDGAELHAAHSYLLGQFLSPAYNRRTDAYGGSVPNRARLAIEAAAAVRERVGSEFVLGIRLSFDEWLGDAGITPEQSEECLDLLAGTGLFDFFNISGGGYHSMHKAVAPMNVDEGHMVPFGHRAKRIVGDRAKVMIVGRIVSLRIADRVIADGAADLVGMTRAHMVDPFLVAKATDGRIEDTMQCVGANECFNSGGRQIVCMMNPVMGRERRWGMGTLAPVAPADARRILVVGGGPAGMKTAAVAASRGHAVTLVEGRDELGGHLNLIKRMPTRGGWQRAIDNLSRPLVAHGVDVRLGAPATAETLGDAGADTVVFATGSVWESSGFSPLRPDRDAVPGSKQGNVLGLGAACERAIADPRALGERVLILDETGAYLPVGLAELLADAGCAVEVVTPAMAVGEQLAVTMDLAYVYPRLHAKGVGLTPQTEIASIDGTTVTLAHKWSGARRACDVDHVVMSVLRRADDELFQRLRGTLADARRVGDVLAPRTTAAVIYEGEALGRSL